PARTRRAAPHPAPRRRPRSDRSARPEGWPAPGPSACAATPTPRSRSSSRTAAPRPPDQGSSAGWRGRRDPWGLRGRGGRVGLAELVGRGGGAAAGPVWLVEFAELVGPADRATAGVLLVTASRPRRPGGPCHQPQ